MNFWVTAFCISALGISLLLIVRRKKSATHRTGAALLQIAIWGLVWALVNPPALLPPEKATVTPVELPQDRDALLQLPSAELAAQGELKITGDGLSRDALRDLPPVRLETGAPGNAAAWQVHWSRQLILGEVLQLRISQESATAARFILEDPFGGEVDSAILASEHGEVLLTDTPKLSGRWLYHVRIETHTDGEIQVRREPLPLQVHAAQAPRVLLWLAKPGFESAALSRWLRQSGTPARVITRLAPQVVRRESFNGLEASAADPLDPQGPFDLLILDSRLWPQLSRTQRRQLPKVAVEKSLLWLVGAESPPGFLEYAHTRNMALASETVREVNYQAATGELPPLTLTGYRPQRTLPGDIRLGEKTFYWARSQRDQSLGFALFDHSHRWITAGHAENFSRLWKTLFDHQLAHRGDSTPVNLQSPLPRAQHRVSLCSEDFVGSEPRLSELEGEIGGVPQTGIALPGKGTAACYSWWPRRAGWHRVDYGSGAFHFHVFAPDAWRPWQRAIMRADTRQMANARLGPSTSTADRRNPVPRHWTSVALILLLAFTWWRERRWLR